MQAIKQRVEAAMWRNRNCGDAIKFWQKQLEALERWEAATPDEKNRGILGMADYLEGLGILLEIDEKNLGQPIPWPSSDEN